MTDTAELFIDSRCELGEGPLWHPGLQQLFWFDIINQTLFSAGADGHMRDRFIFKDMVSAAGIIDNDALVIASATAMLRLELETDDVTVLAPLEADKPGTRSNDGRVHPSGSFWIGTMSRRGGAGVNEGSIYLYRDGQVEVLFPDITIPNSICFSPDGRIGYFSNGNTKSIHKVALDPATGRPVGPVEVFAAAHERGGPDGSIVDSAGFLWNARWGGSCVIRFAPDGTVDRVVEVPVPQVSCPCLGGADRKTLYLTSAREHLTPAQLEESPYSGSVFSIRVATAGQPEPRVAV